MSLLGKYLKLLERRGVREVVLQSNSPASVRVGNELTPVGDRVLPTAQLLTLLEGSIIARWIPAEGEEVRSGNFSDGGVDYAVQIRRYGERLQVRLARRRGPAASGEVAAASSDRSRRPAGAAPPRPPRGEASGTDPGRAFGAGRDDLLAETSTVELPALEAPALELGAPTGESTTPSADAATAGVLLAMEGVDEPGDDELPAVLNVFGVDTTRHSDDQPPSSRGAEVARGAGAGAGLPAPGGLGGGLELAELLPSEPPPPAPQDAGASDTGNAYPSLVPQRLSGDLTSIAPAPRALGLLELLHEARARHASDVHISSNEAPRIRRLGRLLREGAPIPHDDVVALIDPLLEPRHHRTLESRGYVDLAVTVPSAGRVRVNVCHHRRGTKAAIRLIEDTPRSVDELGLPPEVRGLLNQHQGLVVVSGPAGHGKTTTLAALVRMFAEARAVHIITVEDPVEIIHPRTRAVVTQREVGRHTQSFHAALKGALREDPDIIAIGELRDLETVEMALEAAETGHLVIATMSTPSGARTIARLIDLFPPDDQSQVRATLAGTLKLVISQRLLPLSDGSGMIAAAEIITGHVPLWSLIKDDKLFQLPSLQQRGRAFGMVRLDDSLNELVTAGRVSADDARAVADDPRAIGAAAKAPGGTLLGGRAPGARRP